MILYSLYYILLICNIYILQQAILGKREKNAIEKALDLIEMNEKVIEILLL